MVPHYSGHSLRFQKHSLSAYYVLSSENTKRRKIQLPAIIRNPALEPNVKVLPPFLPWDVREHFSFAKCR